MKEHFLTILRNRNTQSIEFRAAAGSLGSLIAEEISEKTELETCTVETPLGWAKGGLLPGKTVLIPILRSGLVLLPPFLRIFQNSSIGFFGIRRNESTARPSMYYEHLPHIDPLSRVFLLDPILATGGTARLALEKLQQNGAYAPRITLVTFLAAREGLECIRESHPAVKIFTAAIDEMLNAEKYIVPGLGDFGDRFFG